MSLAMDESLTVAGSKYESRPPSVRLPKTVSASVSDSESKREDELADDSEDAYCDCCLLIYIGCSDGGTSSAVCCFDWRGARDCWAWENRRALLDDMERRFFCSADKGDGEVRMPL